jgi:ketosteroid isomerase-like protein
MSRENVELVRSLIPEQVDLVQVFSGGIEALATAFVGLLDKMAPDAEILFVPVAPGNPGADYEGLAGLMEGWRDWLAPWESYVIEVEELVDAGNSVVALVNMRARTEHGGVEMAQQGATIWTVEGGKIVRMSFHLDRGDALARAGVDES